MTQKSYERRLENDQPLILLRSLATQIGINNALVLGQFEYLLENSRDIREVDVANYLPQWVITKNQPDPDLNIQKKSRYGNLEFQAPESGANNDR